MPLPINKYKLIVSRYTVDLDAPLDREVLTYVSSELSIHNVQHPSMEDGTYDEVYVGKLFGKSEVKQGEKIVRIKDKRSSSKLLKGAIWHLQNDVEKMDEDIQEFYEDFVKKILIPNLPKIYSQFKNI